MKPERNCHLPASGGNYTTHHEALQYFSRGSEVSLHKNEKIYLRVL